MLGDSVTMFMFALAVQLVFLHLCVQFVVVWAAVACRAWPLKQPPGVFASAVSHRMTSYKSMISKQLAPHTSTARCRVPLEGFFPQRLSNICHLFWH